MLSRAQLERHAADSGFQLEAYERGHVLVRLLDALRGHPFLGPRLALKGGAALNLFVLALPRLSVDIDLNYVGAADRATMLVERPRLEQALGQVSGRMGLTIRHVPTEHAGGKWRLAYQTALRRQGNVELDVNFMLRTPLWPAALRDSCLLGGVRAAQVPLLDEHELTAGKLAALVARSAARDLFDVRELLRRPGLDPAKLRLGFVVYGGANRVDWRQITVERIRATPADVDTQLVPMLRRDLRPAAPDLAAWTAALVRETRELMAAVLPLREHERTFLDRLNATGHIAPDLLTEDPGMQAILQHHPGLRWKAANVRQRLGLPVDPLDTTQT
jgi:predicted nucleotidyltransferase component of viral defense system